MAEESKNDVTSTETEVKKKKKKKGVLSRLWNALFRGRGDDFEKRLEHISKEEAAVLARIARRAHRSRRTTRQLIIFSLLSEVIAVCYAVVSTRSIDLDWKKRAMRVMPMFLLPALWIITHSGLKSFTKMRDQKDHRTLENLRAERQAKIDELKERTNYYTTQQLIQRYDPDPAAKAAAATVLASKLGADSGLKVHVGDDSNRNAPAGKSHDVDVANVSGLRQRKQSQSNTSGADNVHVPEHEKGMLSPKSDGAEIFQQQQLVVEHYPQSGATSNDGGWIGRLAALLVGEDPTQSYALICGNCRMHNGLVRKEDFPYVTYYCPHCKALNRAKQMPSDHASISNTPTSSSMEKVEDNEVAPSQNDLTGEKAAPSPAPGVSES